MYLFFQSNTIPVWIAIIGFIGTILTSGLLSGLVMFFVTKRKFDSEVANQNIKNQAENLKNEDFENEAIGKAFSEIDRLRSQNLELGNKAHELTKKLEIAGYNLAEERGKTMQAVDDRDKVFHKIQELEDKIVFEHNSCQQQIIQLGLKYESQIRELKEKLNARINQLFEALQLLIKHEIELPERLNGLQSDTELTETV